MGLDQPLRGWGERAVGGWGGERAVGREERGRGRESEVSCRGVD